MCYVLRYVQAQFDGQVENLADGGLAHTRLVVEGGLAARAVAGPQLDNGIGSFAFAEGGAFVAGLAAAFVGAGGSLEGCRLVRATTRGGRMRVWLI